MLHMPALTEKQWQRQITDLAELCGWDWYHPWLSLHSPRGWPDLALCRPPRLILAELKTENQKRSKLTPAQQKWRTLLEACDGIEYRLWRPRDWDEVTRTLAPDGRRIQ